MAHATRHPDTGIYQDRKRVPPDIRALVGGPTHAKTSLGTRDPKEAEMLFRAADAEHEARWAQVRVGVQHLDDMQVAALAREIYRDVIGRMGNQRDAFAHHAWAGFKWGCELLDKEEFSTPFPGWLDKLDRLHGPNVDGVLNARGLTLAGETWSRLLVATHREMKLATDIVLRQAKGDWSADANLARHPGIEFVSGPDPKQSFEAVWHRWLTEAKPSDGTVRRWKPPIDRMLAFVGTADMSAITEAQLNEWIESLFQDGLHNNTIGKVDLTAVKRIFAFAKAKKIISVNPAADLKVSSGTRFATVMRGFRPDEAATILRATLLPPSARVSPALAAARRWVPWICAYTGARVNEVTQARFKDFSHVGGMTILHVRAEAGTAKTGDRDVPLHDHIIVQGFGEFLATKAGEDPLFYALRAAGKAASKIPPYAEMGGRLSKWVRELGLTDKHLDPNHAWRHRFKGYAAKAGVDERVADALQGHAPTTQGRRYGEVDLEERIAAVRKLPRILIV